MIKKHIFQQLSPIARRRFLQSITALWGAKLIDNTTRYGCLEHLLSESEAFAIASNEGEVLNFIEIGLRDQFDWSHAFVAPGLATDRSLRRGEEPGKVALFDHQDTLIQKPGQFYLTSDAQELEPHTKNIAVLDYCELASGEVHNHEGAGALRSPGRSPIKGPGRTPMWLHDPVPRVEGNELHYSATPTPAIFHNHYLRSIFPWQRSGIILKGNAGGVTTVYHHTADLTGAAMPRIYTRENLRSEFSSAHNSGPELVYTHKSDLINLIKSVDKKFLERLNQHNQAVNHELALTNVERNLNTVQKTVDLSLTSDELAYWQANIDKTDEHNLIHETGGPLPLWEQMSYAAKLIGNGILKSVSIEFRYTDYHGLRTPQQIKSQASMLAGPLSRLIIYLKEKEMFDNTLIAIYNVDGSRAPTPISQGDEGKSGVILVGGKVKGGYYGDMKVRNYDENNKAIFQYHMADPQTGEASSLGTINNDMRTSGASVWKTIAKLSGIPENLIANYSDVKEDPYLNFLL